MSDVPHDGAVCPQTPYRKFPGRIVDQMGTSVRQSLQVKRPGGLV